ncbi:MAG: hypothetical protein LIO62_01410 [Clostridiales bacterium]|nr:hypothetical protein [Clostridiales bacterium]
MKQIHVSAYTEDSYITPIQTICSDLKADIKTQAENASLNYTESIGENVTSDIEQYITDAVSLGNIDSIKSIINIGNVAVSIIIGVSAVFSAVLIAILYFIGAHRYRSVRQISISVLSAGGLHLFTALIAYIVISVKKVDLYPIYLRDAFMNFVYNFIGTLASVGAILLIISLMISCFAWLKKKKEN